MTATETERGVGEGEAAAAEGRGRVPILVVDDEPRVLVVFADVLGAAGYDVEVARDGGEALERFAPGRHAALVTDLRMPGLGGIDLVERVRARDPDVAMVILTGYATVDTATRAVAAGAFDYLMKPVDMDRLKGVLARAVERRRLLDENRRLVAELTEASAIPAGVAVVRPAAGEARVERANEAFRRFGAAGRGLVRALAPDLDRVAAGERLRGRELEVAEDGCGPEWCFRVSAVPLGGGRVLLTAEDVTDAAKLEDDLVQVEKLISLGILAGGVVHDLASPLTAILGTTEMLIDDGRDAPLGEEVRTIRAAAEYMRDICGRLTEFSRRARRGEEAATAVDEVVEKSLAFARYAKKLAGVAVEASLAPGLPPVAAQPSELIQVVVNLVANAADAMLAAAARTGRAPRLEVATAAAGPLVRLSVRDNGPGIPDEVRGRLFEPFFTTKGAGKGTGLGLFTSRRIVRRIGGRMDFETGPGGTTFVLELPAGSG